MEEFYFLFGLGMLWTVFAVVQDLKKTEVSNWLNFSLIGFGLAYRVFYSIVNENGMFFVSGLLGFIVFFVLAHGFYYGRAFAGGDAKLLMGFGVILPYSNLAELLYLGAIFIFLLLFLGAVYSLIYSLFIAAKNKEKFRNKFVKEFRNYWQILVILFILALMLLFFRMPDLALFFVLLALLFLLYFYVMALDVCMIRLIKARDLREGDWLERDVNVGRTLIKKRVHGLSVDEIKMLIRVNKKVLIKAGIPFTPAFLLALLAMAPFFLISEFWAFLFSFLS